jgi:hypothetical protein
MVDGEVGCVNILSHKGEQDASRSSMHPGLIPWSSIKEATHGRWRIIMANGQWVIMDEWLLSAPILLGHS